MYAFKDTFHLQIMQNVIHYKRYKIAEQSLQKMISYKIFSLIQIEST